MELNAIAETVRVQGRDAFSPLDASRDGLQPGMATVAEHHAVPFLQDELGKETPGQDVMDGGGLRAAVLAAMAAFHENALAQFVEGRMLLQEPPCCFESVITGDGPAVQVRNYHTPLCAKADKKRSPMLSSAQT